MTKLTEKLDIKVDTVPIDKPPQKEFIPKEYKTKEPDLVLPKTSDKFQ